jgi:hypothetical protein
MRDLLKLVFVASLIAVAACAGNSGAPVTASPPTVTPGGTLARIYYWRAKPGKFDEYTRYVREHAEPIDGDAKRHGAFLSVTTYMTQDTLSPWTHMRVFILRDSAQLQGLGAALDEAGARVEPDSVKRRQASTYGAGLRDAVGSETAVILR